MLYNVCHSVFLHYSTTYDVFLLADKVDSNVEASLVVQALRINTLSKLTFSDSIAFDALLRDVFPGVPFKDIEYETLREKLKEVCAESNLVANDIQVGGRRPPKLQSMRIRVAQLRASKKITIRCYCYNLKN